MCATALFLFSRRFGLTLASLLFALCFVISQLRFLISLPLRFTIMHSRGHSPTTLLQLSYTRFYRAGETVFVKGVLGGKTRLPCRVDVPNCGEVFFITWTKSDTGLAESEHWTRIYLYSDAVEKPLRDLVSRAKFTLSSKESAWPSLELDKLRYSDETYYKCDVTYIQGKCPSLTLVRLEVQGKCKWNSSE